MVVPGMRKDSHAKGAPLISSITTKCAGHESFSMRRLRIVALLLIHSLKFLIMNGGDDGARTRDLCRDRMATPLESWLYEGYRGTKRHRKERSEPLLCPRLCPRFGNDGGKSQTLAKLRRAGTCPEVDSRGNHRVPRIAERETNPN